LQENKVVERVLQVTKEKGVSDQALCRFLNANRNKVDDWKKGKSSPTTKEVSAIAERFDVSGMWLLTGHGTMEHQRAKWEDEKHPLPEAFAPEERIAIPLYGSIAASFGKFEHAEPEGYEYFDKSSIVGRIEDYVCLRVKGDSMSPKLEEDDLVLVRMQSDVDDGKICIVAIDSEEATIKRFKRGRDYVELIPSNPAHDSRIVEGDELKELYIIGLVTEMKRKF